MNMKNGMWVASIVWSIVFTIVAFKTEDPIEREHWLTRAWVFVGVSFIIICL